MKRPPGAIDELEFESPAKGDDQVDLAHGASPLRWDESRGVLPHHSATLTGVQGQGSRSHEEGEDLSRALRTARPPNTATLRDSEIS